MVENIQGVVGLMDEGGENPEEGWIVNSLFATPSTQELQDKNEVRTNIQSDVLSQIQGSESFYETERTD
jgi:hypothetical protein